MMVVRDCYYARPIHRRGGKLIPGPERRFSSAEAAIEAAQQASRSCAGGVAFQMAGDPLLGIWDDARLLASYGDTGL